MQFLLHNGGSLSQNPSLLQWTCRNGESSEPEMHAVQKGQKTAALACPIMYVLSHALRIAKMIRNNKIFIFPTKGTRGSEETTPRGAALAWGRARWPGCSHSSEPSNAVHLGLCDATGPLASPHAQWWLVHEQLLVVFRWGGVKSERPMSPSWWHHSRSLSSMWHNWSLSFLGNTVFTGI